jgi:ribosomal protein S24E
MDSFHFFLSEIRSRCRAGIRKEIGAELRREKTMNQELLRIVDNIARDKNIDKESIFVDLEEAMVSAARKHFGEPESNIVVKIDRSKSI